MLNRIFEEEETLNDKEKEETALDYLAKQEYLYRYEDSNLEIQWDEIESICGEL